MAKRYRDWGTLKFLLRGIEKHIPSIENVFLLVSGDSQVPSWVDRSVVRVVLHRDIIPERFLPTFNSTTIEMFMHRIPGLAEEFLYFNDDMFPVMDCAPEDFFRDGKAVIGFAHHLFAGGKYKKRVRNSDHQARKALGKRPGLFFVRPQHTCSPIDSIWIPEQKEYTRLPITSGGSYPRKAWNPRSESYSEAAWDV